MSAAGTPANGAARYAGTRVQRVEDARLLTGAGTFVDDITRPGMLHACFVRSPHPRARIVSIDACAALGMPGVQRDNPSPTDEEIRDALSGNLCRCTGYQGILAAVRAAATISNEAR